VAPVRSRSTRRSEGPVAPGETPENYYRSDENAIAGRRDSKGKAIDRGEWTRRESVGTSQPRKGSVSDAEAKRRREWAPDRSPLQRLELTLDSITKEEKRARVEEAELLAREAKAGRGGERANQNSVRFRNRPVAKAPDTSQAEPQTLPDAGLVRNLSTKQKDQLQRSGTVEKKRPSASDVPPETGRGFDYQSKPEIDDPKTLKTVNTPQQGQSMRDKSAIPIAVGAVGAAAIGLSRSTSNKLKKSPPGDPWFNRRVDAEREFQEIAPRKASVSGRQQPVSGPPRGTALNSHPQIAKDKELPSLPSEARAPAYPINNLDPDSDDEIDDRPVRRGSSNKILQLTGEAAAPVSSRAIPPSQMYGKRTDNLARAGSQRKPENESHAESASANDKKHSMPPSSNGAPGQSVSEQDPRNHHRMSNLLHLNRHNNIPGQGVYVPSRRLDEWKKGGAVLLDGPMLDLDVIEQTEAEKDKTWWEAGNTGRRRRSSTTKQRKAEAFDGEMDSNGIVFQVSPTVTDDCEGCISKQDQPHTWLQSHVYCSLRHKRRKEDLPVFKPGNLVDHVSTSRRMVEQTSKLAVPKSKNPRAGTSHLSFFHHKSNPRRSN